MGKHELPEVPVLPPGWRRLLLRLGEECAEVVQAVSKVQIFGPDDDYYGNGVTALHKLADEVDDVRVIIDMCIELGIDIKPCDDRQARKRAKLEKMFGYAQRKIAVKSGIPDELLDMINTALIQRKPWGSAVFNLEELTRNLCDALNVTRVRLQESQWIPRALKLYEEHGWEVVVDTECVEIKFTTTAQLVTNEQP